MNFPSNRLKSTFFYRTDNKTLYGVEAFLVASFFVIWKKKVDYELITDGPHHESGDEPDVSKLSRSENISSLLITKARKPLPFQASMASPMALHAHHQGVCPVT
jgi:hypothetical protein